MAFAGNKDHIALLSHHAGRTDGLTTVYDADDFLHLTGIEALQHIVDDVLRLLETGIVRRDDHTVALLHRLLGHQRTLALIAVTTCTTDGDHLTLAVEHLVDGIEHILQSVGRMGIIDDGGITLRRMDGLQTTAHTLQRAEDEQDVVGFLAQHNRCTIDGEQVAYIELSDELHAHLLAVDVEIHTLEVTLDELRLKVRHTAGGIGLHLSLTILHHKHSVLIVGIGDGEGIFPQTVEEGFLRITIVLEGAVIVEMVTRQVRK